MDPRSTAQDVHRCDLCETAIVHSYCDFCHANLCKPCILDHILDEYDKHKIVPFQERRSTLIHSKCETHPHRNCEFQCKDCNNIFVCSSCMASTQHKGHNFVEVTEVYKAKKGDIRKDTKELENHISPTYEEIAFDLENQLASLDGGYDKLTTTMSKQGEQWHREIDNIINKMKTEISEIRVKHKELLQKHLNEIKQIQFLIKETLHALRTIEESTEVSSTIECNSKIREFSKPPPKVKVTLPTFIPKPIDPDKLYRLFGQITPLSTATEENVPSLNQPNTSVKELLDEPELVTKIQTGLKNLRNVTCVNEDMIWTSGMSTDIKCFNNKDGGSDLKILTESELEELTLKEANRAADCTDHKSQGADTILCIDTSSSMEGKKFQQITEFIESFLEGIEDVAVENSLEENIAVVSFGNETRVVQNLTNDYSKIRDAVESLETGGPSPIMTGLALCMSAIYNRGGVVTFRERKIFPRIILLTDGGVTDQRIFSGPDTIVKQGGTKKEVWHKLMEFAEWFRTHADPRNLVCVPIGEDADLTLLGQLVNTAGGILVQPEDVQKISHHFLINTVVANVIHDGALRGPELSDDELKQKVQATEGAGDFTEAEVEETLAMIKRDSEQRAQGGATAGLDSSITETKEMPPIGSRVRRGPDWRWDNQDDNLPGTVVAHEARGYLTVEWDNGNRGKYRYGAENGAKDVRMVDEPRMLPPGMMVALGVRARRGTDWEWGPQDGGEGSSGVIFKVEDSGIVHVRWDNGKRGNYRFGLFGKYDVEVCPQCIETEGATGLSDGGSPQESSQW